MPIPNHTGAAGLPGLKLSAVRGFFNGNSPVFEYPYALSGVTKDGTGTPLANVVVQEFRTDDDSYVHQTTSDANGAYSLPASNVLPHYLVAYKAGSPDVAGTTRNDLVGA